MGTPESDLARYQAQLDKEAQWEAFTDSVMEELRGEWTSHILKLPAGFDRLYGWEVRDPKGGVWSDGWADSEDDAKAQIEAGWQDLVERVAQDRCENAADNFNESDDI